MLGFWLGFLLVPLFISTFCFFVNLVRYIRLERLDVLEELTE